MNRFTRLLRAALLRGAAVPLLGALALLPGTGQTGQTDRNRATHADAIMAVASSAASSRTASRRADAALMRARPAPGGPASLHRSDIVRDERAREQEGATTVAGDAASRNSVMRAVNALGRNGRPIDVASLLPLLHDADQALRDASEAAIWSMWGRSGDPETDALFRTGVRQLGRRELLRAEHTFSRVIATHPEFAEAWNKRATVRFLRDDLDGAMSDSLETLARVPDHFGTLSGLGHIWFRLDDTERAIAWWRRALAVNPNLERLRRSIEAIERERPGFRRIVT